MAGIRAIFFDVAHTLLDKPGVLVSMRDALALHGLDVPLDELRFRHSLMMEAIVFPDRTDSDFYRSFNAAVIRALGAVPTPAMLDAVFAAATYQPWVPFDDARSIGRLALPRGILSNWDHTLEEKLGDFEDCHFDWVLGSSRQGSRKPDPAFFRLIPECTGLSPGEIAYVGDSMRLDIEPATRLGLRAILIDRNALFPHATVPRIVTLDELEDVL